MIRRADSKDIDAVYQLICQLENELFDAERLKTMIADDLKVENHFCYVDELNGEVVGMIHLRISSLWHHKKRIMEIMELIVDEKYRHQGIGRELFEAAFTLAKGMDCEQIELATNRKRKAAHAFYEKQGMIKTHHLYVMKL